MNGTGRIKHTTNRGVEIDMEALANANETAVAVTGRGNDLRMNARGDVLGSGGQVVKRREQIEQEYNAAPAGVVKNVNLKDITPDQFESPAQAIERLAAAEPVAPKSTPQVDAPANVINRNRARQLIDKSE